MRVFNKPVRSSTYYKHAFERLFGFLALNSKHVRLMVEAETTTFRFLRTLIAEEAGRQVCTPDQASYEGEQILALLNRLFFLLEENLENHRLLINLAVSTGVWIADRQGEIKELELIVSGIATFANLTADRQELEELYEISLKIMHAADGFLKADIHKQSPRCPWRLLCLN
ncbi:MAG: hypothetical protein MI754_08210, partial [Chromatiales bacterium]|nr:hypothetical protein [Chromatiales bacterium]